MYNDNIEVVYFIIEDDKKLTTGGKYEVNVTKYSRINCFCCFLHLKLFGGILMESS